MHVIACVFVSVCASGAQKKVESKQKAPKKQTITATHTAVVGSACATTPPDWREDAAAVAAAVDLFVCVCVNVTLLVLFVKLLFCGIHLLLYNTTTCSQ